MPIAKTWLLLLVLSLLVAAVTLPRFNRADYLVDAMTGDRAGHHEVYVGPVQWIRGKMGLYGAPDVPGEQLLEAPFSYRLVVPTLAAVLPFQPMTAINMLNVLFVVSAVLLLYRLQRRLAIADRDALLGCALFAVLFPTFYYSTIGWVDPVVVFAVTACLNLIYDRRHSHAALVIGFGFLAKENIVMVLPALAAGAWRTSGSWKQAVLWTMLATAIWLGLFVAVRTWVPVPLHWDSHWYIVSLEMIERNVLRSRSWLTLMLCAATVAAPFVLRKLHPLAELRRRAMDPLWLPMWAGLAGAAAHYGYSWLVAHTDGRMFWPIFCFAIPIAIHLTSGSRWARRAV